MKKSTYILSTAALLISVLACVVGGIIIVFQKPLLGHYSGGMDLAYFSGLSNLMSISTSIASVAGFIIIFVCGLSIGAKLLEKRKSIEKTENNQEV